MSIVCDTKGIFYHRTPEQRMFAMSVSPFLNRVNIDCTYDRCVVTVEN